MFIGKSVCIGAAAVIGIMCTAATLDKNVSAKNKAALIGLASGLAAIVYSL